MMLINLIFSALLVVASGITTVGPPDASGGASCTPNYTESTWDSLADWTQDSQNAYSADSTNDELDVAPSFGYEWIYNDANANTDNDHCVKVLVKTMTSFGGGENVGIMLRTTDAPSSGGAYTLYWYNDGYSIQYVEKASGDLANRVTLHNTEVDVDTLTAGDYIAFCVNGESTSTEFYVWNFGASDPGDCPSDWGTADWSPTGCSSNCEDGANLYSGLIFRDYSTPTSSAVFDEIVGVDYP